MGLEGVVYVEAIAYAHLSVPAKGTNNSATEYRLRAYAICPYAYPGGRIGFS